MSESTRTTADGGDSDTLDVEDLFATDETDISIDDGESDDETVIPGSGTVTPDAEDTTADELFAQLRDEQDDADQAHAVDELGDESPDEIISRADEEEVHVDQIDDAIRADEGALDDLLLTERREADGFLWVETEDDDATDDVGSLFAPDDSSSTNDRSESATADRNEPATADESSTDASAAESSDDEFSLTDDSPGSFDARAATFEGEDDFAVDAAAFEDDDEDASTTESEDAALASDDEPNDSDDDVEGGDPESTDDDDQDPGDDGDDGDDGLASRIRSILTG
ncbi:hypothetical protein [Halorubellus salinus]|uniref:hypothetical protein n=1 Tax=Halorubellus salinus TaxID=755309 RepID=UPI001D074A07|nr:hypothetical protein [Halorubellus salinus]